MLVGKVELIDKTVFNLLAEGSLVNDEMSPAVGGQLKSLGVMSTAGQYLDGFEVKALLNGSMLILKEGKLVGSCKANAETATLTLELAESLPDHYLQLHVA